MIPLAEHNDNYKYLLTCIDVFSIYAWGIRIKNKTEDDVVDAFKIIFKEKVLNKLQTDNGKEFYNDKLKKYLKEYNVHHFSSFSPLKASVAERFIRTLKGKMWKYFTKVKNHKWIDIIDYLVYNYNTLFHRSNKMTPIEASKKENKVTVRSNLYSDMPPKMNANFRIGDKIRVSKHKSKKTLEKGYQQNYTTEIFEVCDLLKSIPVTYRIKDENNEIIEGIFYEQELVKYDRKDDVYEL